MPEERVMPVRTPVELIELYWDRVWNRLETELIREICADPIVRHDPGSVTVLSHDEQIARVQRSGRVRPFFTHRVLHGDDSFVTSVWNMYTREGTRAELCGIEVFRAENGRLTDCWNSTYMPGRWGEAQDAFDPSKLAAPPILDSVEKIDADWLQRVFAAGGVAAQRIAMLAGVSRIGHGTTSAAVRVQAAYNAGHVTSPPSVVCKIGREPAQAAPGVGPFAREAKAYVHFGASPPFRVPKLYYAAGENGLSNLVLEDLTGTAEPGDQIAGCSPAQAAAVVAELAALHKAYWMSSELERLDWLMDPRSLARVYPAGAAVLHDWLGRRLSTRALAAIDRFAPLVRGWLAAAPPRRTLLHGDPRVDNVLFEPTADGGIRACLIDWQTVRAGDPQYDLAYFLTGSLSPDDRRACERDLIAAHARAIAEVDRDYGIETALASYRFNVTAGLWLTVVAASAVERTYHNADLLTALAERNAAAVADWDGFALIESRVGA
jgi:aminoglycoside phosphotransferase (APT) family kinase protein